MYIIKCSLLFFSKIDSRDIGQCLIFFQTTDSFLITLEDAFVYQCRQYRRRYFCFFQQFRDKHVVIGRAAKYKKRHQKFELLICSFREIIHQLTHRVFITICIRKSHISFILSLIFLLEFLLHHDDFLLYHRLDERHDFLITYYLTYLSDSQLCLHLKRFYDKVFVIAQHHGVEFKIVRQHNLRLTRQLQCRRKSDLHHIAEITEIIR